MSETPRTDASEFAVQQQYRGKLLIVGMCRALDMADLERDLAAANAEIARLRGHLTEVKVAMATLIDNQEEVEEELLNERSRAEAAERERDALRNRCQDAETIILRGVEIMAYDQVGQWAGVRAWLEQDTQYYIDAAMGKEK